MESDQLQAFNERLSQWISNQGFWFQLRYSMAGGGYSSATYHFLRLLFRMFLFLVVVGIGGWVYLVKRVDSASFPQKLQASIGTQLDASEATVGGFRRVQSKLEFRQVSCTGGRDAFYSRFKAWNIRCNMGLLDGLVGVWKPGPISVDRLEMDLRAGSEDAAEAMRRSNSFLKTFSKLDISSVDIANATLRWGYSDLTKGSIENSHLSAQRTDSGWRLQFHGGYFTQGFLKRVDLKKLVVFAEPGGLRVEEGEFIMKSEEQGVQPGSLSLTGVTVSGGDRPRVAGFAKLKNAPVESLMPQRFQGFIEGRISSDLKLSGSTNSPEGLGFEGQVVLEGKDKIVLRDRVHLLQALTNAGSFTKYRKVDFTEGSFVLKTGGGTVDIREVNLKSGDTMTLQGRMLARPPTNEEINIALRRPTGATNNISPLFAGGLSGDDEPDSKKAADNEDLSLKKAATEDKKDDDKTVSPEDTGFFARMGQGQIDARTQRLQEQGREAISRTLRYEGLFRVTIPGDSFDRAGALHQAYPPDPVTGRILLNVPIEGNLYELTLKQAEDIYLKGTRRD